MILRFPDLATLQLALTTGAVPGEVSGMPARTAEDPSGNRWIETSASLSSAARKSLRQLGVVDSPSCPLELGEQVACWYQLLPLVPDARLPDTKQQRTVLFELRGPRQFREMVFELLRLGNDRQSFRHLDNGTAAWTLLRVSGPPYYSLLRAMEQVGSEAIRAYQQCAPHVWVQLGYRHPLAERISPAPGRFLLLGAPRRWILLDEQPWLDVYSVLDFPLTQQPVCWKESALEDRLAVRLRLVPSSSQELPQLWVLRDNGVEQLEEFVAAAGDGLISRLSFAVGRAGQQTTVVLRVRPSKDAPPPLVFEGTALRPYLKLANLFVPCGMRLHPPLRREAVARLLAPHPTSITWLQPTDEGMFIPESLPDDAFGPLSRWVDYVLDHEHRDLQPWVDSHRFDFESFVCSDDQLQPPAPARASSKRAGKGGESAAAQSESATIQKKSLPAVKPPAATGAPQQAHRAQRELRALEARFLELKSPLDSDQRSALWLQMARLNSRLGHARDAMICWANTLWEQDPPSRQQLSDWLADCSPAGHAADPAGDIPHQLEAAQADVAAASGLVAQLNWIAWRPSGGGQLAADVGRVGRFLEKHEAELPIRTAWLGWMALAKISRGDVLALARARDRLLERLYHQGMKSDCDLPSFLRLAHLASSDHSERLRRIGQPLQQLRDLLQEWVKDPSFNAQARTAQYADLMFAYGLARLGERTASDRLFEAAASDLPAKDPIHHWLRDAFRYRIDQALGGQPATGPLSGELINRLESLNKLSRYKVDRLRDKSWILEPVESLDPYLRWHQRYADPLHQQLEQLREIHDRRLLQRQIPRLWDQESSRGSWAGKARVLTAALELAPRLGESDAKRLLQQTMPVMDQLSQPSDQTMLLEKALLVAAHFDQSQFVADIGKRLDQSLGVLVQEAFSANTAIMDSLESLLTQCIRGLRKMGLRAEIGRLLQRVESSLRRQMAKFRRSRKSNDQANARFNALRLLLQVAAGRFYSGQVDQAEKILSEVGQVLFDTELKPNEQTLLARSYALALSEAPLEQALPRLMQMFQARSETEQVRGLDQVRDNFTTSSHFSVTQLQVAEAAVRALVSDSVTISAESRKWLDDDEFHVRRRIHRDMRKMVEDAGG